MPNRREGTQKERREVVPGDEMGYLCISRQLQQTMPGPMGT